MSPPTLINKDLDLDKLGNPRLGRETGGNTRPQWNARSAPPADNSARAQMGPCDHQQPAPPPTALERGNGGRKAGGRRDDNHQQPRDHQQPRRAGAGAPRALGGRAMCGGQCPRPRRPRPRPHPYTEGGHTHTNSGNFFDLRRGREAGGNRRPQPKARSAPPADKSARAQIKKVPRQAKDPDRNSSFLPVLDITAYIMGPEPPIKRGAHNIASYVNVRATNVTTNNPATCVGGQGQR